MNVVKGCLKDLGLGHLDEPMEVRLRQVRFISSKGSRKKSFFSDPATKGRWAWPLKKYSFVKLFFILFPIKNKHILFKGFFKSPIFFFQQIFFCSLISSFKYLSLHIYFRSGWYIILELDFRTVETFQTNEIAYRISYSSKKDIFFHF